jgi:hypothetical protein
MNKLIATISSALLAAPEKNREEVAQAYSDFANRYFTSYRLMRKVPFTDRLFSAIEEACDVRIDA